jgi:hypothetical protein
VRAPGLAQPRERAARRPVRERTQLPAPSRVEPERVWEFPAFEELAEAMRPALPAGSENPGGEARAA